MRWENKEKRLMSFNVHSIYSIYSLHATCHLLMKGRWPNWPVILYTIHLHKNVSRTYRSAFIKCFYLLAKQMTLMKSLQHNGIQRYTGPLSTANKLSKWVRAKSPVQLLPCLVIPSTRQAHDLAWIIQLNQQRSTTSGRQESTQMDLPLPVNFFHGSPWVSLLLTVITLITLITSSLSDSSSQMTWVIDWCIIFSCLYMSRWIASTCFFLMIFL